MTGREAMTGFGAKPLESGMAGHGGGSGADTAAIGHAGEGVGGGPEHVQALVSTPATAALAVGGPGVGSGRGAHADTVAGAAERAVYSSEMKGRETTTGFGPGPLAESGKAGHGGGSGADTAAVGHSSEGVGGGQEHVQALTATQALAALATGGPAVDRTPGSGKGGGG
jgi:hypothetical protein